MMTRIVMSSISVAIVSGLLLGAVAVWRSLALSSTATTGLIRENNKALDNQIRGLGTALTTLDQALSSQLDASLKVANVQLAEAGGFRLPGGSTAWHAVNQDTQAARDVVLPTMAIGGDVINPATAAAATVPAVDATRNLVGGAATVFQRMNDEGDMLRIATNVMKDDGSRAFGTFIAAKGADGKPNKIIQTVLSGNTFKGVALVVGHWYVVEYQPISVGGRVEGILFVGLEQDNVVALKNAIESEKIGANGYAGLMTVTGKNAGTLRMSGNAKMTGKNLLEAKDMNGKTYVSEALEKAKAQPGNVVSVPFETEKDGTASFKAMYYQPWDVAIVANVYDADFQGKMVALQQVKSSTVTMVIGIIIAFIVALAVAIALSIVVSKTLTKPVIALKNQLNAMVSGVIDLRKSITAQSKDEVGVLAESLNQFASRVKETISKVTDGTNQISQVSEEMSTSAKQLEESSDKFTHEVTQVEGSTHNILEAITQASSATNELNSAISEIADSAAKASGVAGEAESLAAATSQAIADLNTSSEDIGNIISMISSIAEQTNLLALNATIESARAGEAGKGFAVVAGEVKDLAGQTGSATEESSTKIQSIQEQTQSVSESMNRINEVITQINEFQTQIAAAVEEQSATTATVRAGVENNENSIQVIADSLSKVSAASQDTLKMADNTKVAATNLESVSRDVAAQLAVFVVE